MESIPKKCCFVWIFQRKYVLKAGVATISVFYITNNAPCQKGGALSYFFCMVHCYWQGMPVMF